ncbi:MAG: hypothetical protein ACQKBT_10670, partial [Puniceicoccales bacterium]
MKQRRFSIFILFSLFFLLPGLHAADSLADISEQGRAEARRALSALRQFRLQVQEEQLPLEQKIRTLRDQLQEARQELRKLREAADSNDVALADLEREVNQLTATRNTVESLLEEVLEERASSVQKQLDPEYRALYQEWQDSPSPSEYFNRAAPLLQEVVQSLSQSIGGTTASVTIYSPEGKKIQGSGLFLGPLAYFSGADQTGWIETTDPTFPKLNPSGNNEADQIQNTLQKRAGLLPVDATGGAALALRKNAPNLLEEIQRAGIWIYPILLAAVVAFVVVVTKWISQGRVRSSLRKARASYPDVWNSQDSGKQKEFVQRQVPLLRPFWETLWNTRDSDPESR